MSADNIQVAIKVRPLLKKEKDSKLTSQWKIVDNSIQTIESQSEPYYFDHIFDEDATNCQIFDKISKPIVDAALRGFNGTIFAYGQTSSGKTYTMLGDDKNPNNPGVMIMAVQEIFREIEKATDREFLIRVGYIEIYNEKIFDLLNSKSKDELKIYESQNGDVNVNCIENIVRNEQEMLEHLNTGSKARRIGDTNLNERSSRSHAIFRIIIESRTYELKDDSAVQISHLNLVDLAGSERADQTGATGPRLKEGCHINKSLLSLGLVIKKLSENESDKYINYRDSKLTRILQASLGGNALTAIICTIKPTTIEETSSTLNFALRAKSIKNKPKMNEILSDAAMMRRLAKEIARLQSELQVEKSKNSKLAIMKIEKQIQDAELKIVHSHTIGLQRDRMRRRTWCPSSMVVSPKNDTDLKKNGSDSNTNEACIENIFDASPKFLTPLITLRDYKEQQLLQEAWTFSNADFPDINENEMITPPRMKPIQGRVSLTPTPTVRTRYKQLEDELEELNTFNALEKDAELCEAKAKIIALEKERQDYLDIIDSSFENQIKLERAQIRCQELESRISELIEKVNYLELREEKLKIVSDECDRKVHKILMASKDAASLECEIGQLKLKSETREQELLNRIQEKDQRIGELEKEVTKGIASNDGIVNTDVVTKRSASESDRSVDSFSMETTVVVCNNSDTNEVLTLENLKQKLESYENTVSKHETALSQMNSKMQELLKKNSTLEHDNERMSTEIMEHIYENENLTAKCKQLEEDLDKNRECNAALQTKVNDYKEQLDALQKEWCECSVKVSDNRRIMSQNTTFIQSEGELAKYSYLSDISYNDKDSTDEDFFKSILDEIIYRALVQADDRLEAIYNYGQSLPTAPNLSTLLKPDNNSESFEELICDMNRKVLQYEEVNRQLKSRLDEMNENWVHIESQKTNFMQTIEDLETSNGEMEQKLKEAQCRLEELEQNNAKIDTIQPTSESLELNEKLDLMKQQIEQLQKEKELAECQCAEFKRSLLELQAEKTAIAGKLKDLLQQKGEWDTVEEEISNFKDQVTELQKELSKTRCEKEEADEELVRAREKKGEYKEKIEHGTQQISQLEMRNKELLAKLEEFDGLQKALEEKHSELETVQRKLIGSASIIAEFEAHNCWDSNKPFEEERLSLRSEIEKKVKETDELEIRLANMRQEHTQLVFVVNTEKVEKLKLENENKEYKYQIETLDRKLLDMKSALTTFQTSNIKSETDYKELKQIYDELETHQKLLIEQNQKLTEEIATVKEEKSELTERLNDLKATVVSFEKSQAEWKENDRKHVSELVELNVEKNKLENDLVTMKASHETLQANYDEVRREKTDLNVDLEKAKAFSESLNLEYESIRLSVKSLSADLAQLRQERDDLIEAKERIEKEFERQLKDETELLKAELTNARSENLIITDKMESLQMERNDLQILLNTNVSRTKDMERNLKHLGDTLTLGDEKLKNLEKSNFELEEKLADVLNECDQAKLENQRLTLIISDYETKLDQTAQEKERLENEREKIIITNREQFEIASANVTQIKNELENQMQQLNKYRKENDELKGIIHARDTEIQKLCQHIESKDAELMLYGKVAKEKEELLKQLHEMQKMHIYKMKQCQQEIQNLKAAEKDRNHDVDDKSTKDCGGDYWNRLLQSTDGIDVEKQKIIKTLLGENDELRQKNQTLTAELQESRKLLQKDRKSKRHSGHDEKRSLIWTDTRDVGLMTMPTGTLCNCEQLDKELIEIKKTLRIKECQVNTLLMESKHNPLKEDYEALKRSIEEEEAEKKELRKELCKLKLKISELYKETKRCDQCLRRSRIMFTNQCSQTAFAIDEQNGASDGSNLGNNTGAKNEMEHLQLKYENLKRLCIHRNYRIQELEKQLSKEKENETNNGQMVNHMGSENNVETLSRELLTLKKKYDEARWVCNFRDKRIQDLEAQLSNVKNNT